MNNKLTVEQQAIYDSLTIEKAVENVEVVFASISLKLADHLILLASLEKIKDHIPKDEE